MGKRTRIDEYPAKGRGTGGVITIKLKPGDKVAAARVVRDTSLLTFITSAGVVMRTPAEGISTLGRSTQGVAVVNVSSKDVVAGLSCEEPDDELVSDEDGMMVMMSPDGV